MWILKWERNNLGKSLHESQDSQNGMVSTRCHKGKTGCFNYCFPDQDSQTLPFLGTWFLIPLYNKQGSSSYCSFFEQSWPQSREKNRTLSLGSSANCNATGASFVAFIVVTIVCLFVCLWGLHKHCRTRGQETIKRHDLPVWNPRKTCLWIYHDNICF